MTVNEKQFKEKFQEAVVPIISGLVTICMFPDHYSVDWRKRRITDICNSLSELHLRPNNSTHSRRKIIDEVYREEFNDDFCYIQQWFASAAYYQENRPEDDRIIPYADYMTVYEENKERVESALRKLAYLIASQDDSITKFIKDF